MPAAPAECPFPGYLLEVVAPGILGHNFGSAANMRNLNSDGRELRHGTAADLIGEGARAFVMLLSRPHGCSSRATRPDKMGLWDEDHSAVRVYLSGVGH